ALVQAVQARALDRADVDECVLATIVRLDEAVALGSVEPLYGSRSHGNCLSRHIVRRPRTRPTVEFAVFGIKSRATPQASPVFVPSIDPSVWPIWAAFTSLPSQGVSVRNRTTST